VVNSESITLDDVRRDLETRTKQDPSFRLTSDLFTEQLEIMIDRRLLIQEAMKRKLAEDERFVAAIKKFWEQTLIQRLMGQLTREFGPATTVNESEVADYYAKLAVQTTLRVEKTPDKAYAEKLREEASAGPVQWGQLLGPLTYDRLTSNALESAFGLEAGQAALYEVDGGFLVVRMESKTASVPPPLEKIRGQIANLIVRKKQKDSLESWLADRRASADIDIKEAKTDDVLR
jgi:hypothetical protein